MAHAPISGEGCPPLPERFGRYRIIKRLGAGGMGSVYLAEDTQLGRRVALKVPHFSPEDGPEPRQRFFREARIAARLDHVFLCPVYDVGEVDGVCFLTMAYIEGKSLAEKIPEGGMPARPAAALVRKLALGLQEAHGKGVVHRDLKPANIMLKETGQGREPVIVDFGLARRHDAGEVSVTKTGQVMGTLGYMATEQIRGDQEAIGPACDIYALGVILYELLTGELPFRGTGLAVVGQILTQEPLPPVELRPDLDPRLEAICLKAMARKVEDRYASMEALATALGDYLRSASTQPSPVEEAGVGAVSTALPPAPAGTTHPASMWQSLIAIPEPEHLSDAKPATPLNSMQPLPVPRHRPEAFARLARPALVAGVLLLGLIVAWASGVFQSKKGDAAASRQLTRAHPVEAENARLRRQAPSEPVAAAPPTRATEEAPKEIRNTIGMKLMLIPAGEFSMGSPDSDRDAYHYHEEKPQHRVRITRPFYLGATEVTQGQYQAVTGANPSKFKGSDDRPVEQVSWDDAIAFCKKLSAREGLVGGDGYRLPTEAEWEYACRAGSITRYSFGDDVASMSRFAWFDAEKTHPVGQKLPNAWGLYDMYGNVGEWCGDWFDMGYYRDSPGVDPLGPSTATERVDRGGGWNRGPGSARSAYRNRHTPEARNHARGFRVARVQSLSEQGRASGAGSGG